MGMKQRKRGAAVLLAAMLLLTGAEGVSAREPVPFDEAHMTLRFGVFSDIHFDAERQNTENYRSTPAKLDAGIRFLMKEIGTEQMPVMVMGGDMNNWNGVSDLQLMRKCVDQTGLDPKKTELFVTPGNHEDWETDGNAPSGNPLTGQKVFEDYNLYEALLGPYVYWDKTRTDAASRMAGFYHTVIGGYHFLSVVGVDGNHSQIAINWMLSQLKAIRQTKDRGKPVFIVTHCPPRNTVFGSETGQGSRWSSRNLAAVLKKYPEAVVFAGHTHADANKENYVWQQDSYVAMHSGALSEEPYNQFAMVELDRNHHIRFRLFHLIEETRPGDAKPSYRVEEYKNRKTVVKLNPLPEPSSLSTESSSASPVSADPQPSRPAEKPSEPLPAEPSAGEPSSLAPTGEESEAAGQASGQETEPAEKPTSAAQPSSSYETSGKTGGFAIGGVIGAMLVAGAVTAVILLKKKKEPKE